MANALIVTETGELYWGGSEAEVKIRELKRSFITPYGDDEQEIRNAAIIMEIYRDLYSTDAYEPPCVCLIIDEIDGLNYETAVKIARIEWQVMYLSQPSEFDYTALCKFEELVSDAYYNTVDEYKLSIIDQYVEEILDREHASYTFSDDNDLHEHFNNSIFVIMNECQNVLFGWLLEDFWQDVEELHPYGRSFGFVGT